MVLPFLAKALPVLGALGGAAGALGGPRHGQLNNSSQIPDWQKKMIQDQYRRQNELASRPLGGAAQGAINQFGDVSNQALQGLGGLTGSDSALGQLASGSFIGSDNYNKLLSQSNERVKEQFNEVAMPGVLSRFGGAGRLGSPSMMRGAEQAQRGLARGLAQNEANLLNNERNRQMTAVNNMANIFGRQQSMAGNRANMMLGFDPSEIARRRLAAQNQLAMGNYGRMGSQGYTYNPGYQFGGAMFGGASLLQNYGLGNQQQQSNVPPGRG